jgi:hypothetical protein
MATKKPTPEQVRAEILEKLNFIKAATNYKQTNMAAPPKSDITSVT